METRLSFVITTIGRRSVHRMLTSIERQMRPDDEIIVVGDVAVLDTITDKFTKYMRHRKVYCAPGNDWGNRERNYALDLGSAFGTHIVFGDDDDCFLSGAVEALHTILGAHPNRPVMFSMVDPNGLVLWEHEELIEGNQGTPMFVFPNVPERIARFSGRYEGDYDFMESTMKLYPPNATVWSREIIYGCRSFGNLPNPKEFASVRRSD